MLQLSCIEVDAHMPPPLAKRMSDLMTEMYGEYLPVTCEWVGTGETHEQVIDLATEHVRAEHAVRACIHEAE